MTQTARIASHELDRSTPAPLFTLISADGALIDKIEELCADMGAHMTPWRARELSPAVMVIVDPRDLTAERREAAERLCAGRACLWLDGAGADVGPFTDCDALVVLPRAALCAASFAAAAATAAQALARVERARAETAALSAQVEHFNDLCRDVADRVAPLAYGLAGYVDLLARDETLDRAASVAVLRDWADQLVATVGWARRAMTQDAGADLAQIVERAVLDAEDGAELAGMTVVVSPPHEPLRVACDAHALREATQALVESVAAREAGARRIEILMWRTSREVCLAVVTGLIALRDGEAAHRPGGLRLASDADARVAAAMAACARLGATVETTGCSANGSTIVVRLPPG